MEKEIIRSIRHSLNFNKDPKLFLIHLVFQLIKISNRFPIKGGIYDTIILTKIASGKSLHYLKHIGLHIGQCCRRNLPVVKSVNQGNSN